MSSNRVLLLCLLASASLVFACHPSCVCSTGHVCDSCVDPNSQIDEYKRSCPCPKGKYTSSLDPFTCTQYMNEDENGNNVSEEQGACEIEIGQKSKLFLLNCDSDYTLGDDLVSNYVTNTVSLDLSHASLDPACEANITEELFYKNPVSGEYEPFDPQYFTITGLTVSIKIPLIKFDELFGKGPLSDLNQFTNTAHFLIKIISDGSTFSEHKWDLFVYTNRDQVELFTIDVTKQETEGCQEGQECIVIADLDTKAIVCQDDTCAAEKTDLVYVVGDNFIAKICFVDPSYTKNLKFIDLYFKNDVNKVFKFTSITNAVQQDYCLIVTLPLVEPSNQANIQVNMVIDDARILRQLADANSSLVNQAFVAKITESSTDISTTTDTDTSNNSVSLMFGMLNAIFVLIAFI